MATAPKPAPYKKVGAISVHLWGQQVGAVALDPGSGYYAFEFAPAFRRRGIDLAPLQLPVARTIEPVIFTDLPEATYKRLPAFLADALPDDFGNALVDKYMAERGISKSQITVLDRLAYMGSRSMGALEFRPQRGPRTRKATAIHLGDLVLQARKAVTGMIDDDDDAAAALRGIIEVGTSAGGARAKAVIAWNRDTGEVRSGQAEAPEGFSHWLLKFDGMGKDQELRASQDYGRIEFVYSQMAREAGIDMMECDLLKENGRAHFVTRRFDREDGLVKHHIQTLCAMNHVDFKKKGANAYAQLFMTIRDLKLDRSAMVEAFRRMVFNVMARNCDDHSKNFSFRLKENSSWELAPAYDVTYAHNPLGEWTHQHLMSVNGKFKDFMIGDLLAEADRFGVGEAKRIIDQVREALREWPVLADKAGITAEVIQQVQRHMLLLDDKA